MADPRGRYERQSPLTTTPEPVPHVSDRELVTRALRDYAYSADVLRRMTDAILTALGLDGTRVIVSRQRIGDALAEAGWRHEAIDELFEDRPVAKLPPAGKTQEDG